MPTILIIILFSIVAGCPTAFAAQTTPIEPVRVDVKDTAKTSAAIAGKVLEVNEARLFAKFPESVRVPLGIPAATRYRLVGTKDRSVQDFESDFSKFMAGAGFLAIIVIFILPAYFYESRKRSSFFSVSVGIGGAIVVLSIAALIGKRLYPPEVGTRPGWKASDVWDGGVNEARRIWIDNGEDFEVLAVWEDGERYVPIPVQSVMPVEVSSGKRLVKILRRSDHAPVDEAEILITPEQNTHFIFNVKGRNAYRVESRLYMN